MADQRDIDRIDAIEAAQIARALRAAAESGFGTRRAAVVGGVADGDDPFDYDWFGPNAAGVQTAREPEREDAP